MSIVFVLIVGVSVTSTLLLKRKVANSTVKYNEETDVAVNSTLDNVEDKENTQSDGKVENTSDNNNITINLLGEIMMGGEVSKNLGYVYSYAFKDIYTITRASDFTYANLSTNITNLDKIEEPKSKYIVTKDVINGINALGIDSISVASDHMLDFSEKMFRTTRGILENSNIYVAGQKDNPVYFEKNNKKIAIISTNSVILGTKNNYENSGISVYSANNLKKNIEEAKKSANVVIVDVHWGRDYEYGVTNEMSQIAHNAIDYGADLVIGTHALGVYPIIKYKDKPIIYSLGYLISDTDYLVGKDSFIFNLVIDSNSKITTLNMIPIYIKDKKQTVLYKNYDEYKMRDYLKQMNDWNVENSLDSKIVDDTIVINF